MAEFLTAREFAAKQSKAALKRAGKARADGGGDSSKIIKNATAAAASSEAAATESAKAARAAGALLQQTARQQANIMQEFSAGIGQALGKFGREPVRLNVNRDKRGLIKSLDVIPLKIKE